MANLAIKCKACKAPECEKKRARRYRRAWKYCSALLVLCVASMPQGALCGPEKRNHGTGLRLPWSRTKLFDASNGSMNFHFSKREKKSPFRHQFGSWLKARNLFRENQGNLPGLAKNSEKEYFQPIYKSSLLNDDDVKDDEEGYSSWFGGNQHNPAVPSLGGLIRSLFSDPERLKIWSMKSIQIFLMWKLAAGVWKAVTELLDEFSAEGPGGGEDVYFCSRPGIQRVLAVLENPTTNSLEGVPRGPLQLANDLLAIGMPIRASANETRTSIESLLQGLTRTEASILLQSLWRPPTSVLQQPGEMWDSVVGLDEVKERLLLTVASSSPNVKSRDGHAQGLVHKTQEAYAPLLLGTDSSSTSHHHGVLLFGEPGCGKTFLVQALAARLQWPCLVVSPSVLMRKYVGETNLKVCALFSLIQKKLSPCIVVLDELDGLFRERHDQEHDASREVKTEFLQWMSGIMAPGSSANRHPPIVVGATNRPSDVDSAILRRLPQRFYVGPPSISTRCQLLRKLLQRIPVADDFNVEYIGQRLEGYTPSDIQQVLRTAARMGPVKEAIVSEQQQKQAQNLDKATPKEARKLTTEDVTAALSHVHATPLSPSYRRALQKFANMNDGQDWQDDSPQGQFPQGQFPGVGHHFANLGTVQAPYHDSATPGSPYDPQQFEPDFDEESEDFVNDEEDSFDTDEDDDDFEP